MFSSTDDVSFCGYVSDNVLLNASLHVIDCLVYMEDDSWERQVLIIMVFKPWFHKNVLSIMFISFCLSSWFFLIILRTIVGNNKRAIEHDFKMFSLSAYNETWHLSFPLSARSLTSNDYDDEWKRWINYSSHTNLCYLQEVMNFKMYFDEGATP